MPSTKLFFSLQDLHHGWWVAMLSDGVNEATIKASYIPAEPLLPLLWAVRRLLLGANDSKCIWWGEPGQHRWLFTRIEKRLQIHILWFYDGANWSDEKGETV